jgi:hypothetical protein
MAMLKWISEGSAGSFEPALPISPRTRQRASACEHQVVSRTPDPLILRHRPARFVEEIGALRGWGLPGAADAGPTH